MIISTAEELRVSCHFPVFSSQVEPRSNLYFQMAQQSGGGHNWQPHVFTHLFALHPILTGYQTQANRTISNNGITNSLPSLTKDNQRAGPSTHLLPRTLVMSAHGGRPDHSMSGLNGLHAQFAHLFILLVYRLSLSWLELSKPSCNCSNVGNFCIDV